MYAPLKEAFNKIPKIQLIVDPDFKQYEEKSK